MKDPKYNLSYRVAHHPRGMAYSSLKKRQVREKGLGACDLLLLVGVNVDDDRLAAHLITADGRRPKQAGQFQPLEEEELWRVLRALLRMLSERVSKERKVVLEGMLRFLSDDD